MQRCLTDICGKEYVAPMWLGHILLITYTEHSLMSVIYKVKYIVFIPQF